MKDADVYELMLQISMIAETLRAIERNLEIKNKTECGKYYSMDLEEERSD